MIQPRPIRARRQIVEPSLSGAQVATLHGVSLKTVARWAEAGHFARYRRTPGGRIEIPVSVYQSFVAANELEVRK